MSQPIVQFVETWQHCIAEVMSQIAAKPVSVSWEIAGADSIPRSGEDDLWVRFRTVLLGDDGELAFHIRSADALTLAQVFMGEKIDASASLTDDSREAVAEASRQIAGRAATELKESFPGCELSFLQEPIPTWTPETAATFRLACDDWSFAAAVLLNSSIARYLTQSATEVAAQASEQSRQTEAVIALSPQLETSTITKAASEPPPTPLSRDIPPPPVNRPKRNNLDLLLDVNLAVTLRFGQRQMTLRDILQLRSGSIIELDRHTAQPVDLLLDDRVIARGEVVVVDGNYGLRVSQICSRSERAGLIA